MKKIEKLDGLLLFSDNQIKDAMHVLNKGVYNFQIVVDKNYVLLGTITDGDIRRAFLEGLTIESYVTDCMNKNPAFSYINSESTYKKLLKDTKSIIKFIPVVDKDKVVKFILIYQQSSVNKIALVMAGGFGKRLGDITKNTPKPLLKLGKEPLLETLLKKLEDSNFTTIYVSTYYLYDQIEDFLKKRESKVNIKILIEDKPLGTAGCISLIPKNNYETLLVINADVITEVNLQSLCLFHQESNNDITITVAKHKDKFKFGVVEFDSNFNFLSLKEKPIFERFILSGIYCLNKNICQLINEENIDMTDLINRAYLLKKNIGIYPIIEFWKDIGSPEDLSSVNLK